MVFEKLRCYPIEKEYVWVRQDGDVFVLKWSIDEKNKLTLTEKSTASPTSSAFFPRPAGTSSIFVRDYFLPCVVMDKSNWECKSRVENESVSMIDGVLTHKYWGEIRVYKTKYKLTF